MAAATGGFAAGFAAAEALAGTGITARAACRGSSPSAATACRQQELELAAGAIVRQNEAATAAAGEDFKLLASGKIEVAAIYRTGTAGIAATAPALSPVGGDVIRPVRCRCEIGG